MNPHSENYKRLRHNARRQLHNDDTLTGNLADIRKDRKLSTAAVAERMGVTEDYVLSLESCSWDVPVSMMRRYTQALGVIVTHGIEEAPENGR